MPEERCKWTEEMFSYTSRDDLGKIANWLNELDRYEDGVHYIVDDVRLVHISDGYISVCVKLCSC